jgi:hypothetical protein
MNSLAEKNEHMRSPSHSPMKKLSANISKLVDDIPDPERKKKKKKKKNKKKDESSMEMQSKASEDEWLSDDPQVVIPSPTPKAVEKQVSEKKDFDVDEIIAKLMGV